MMINSRNILIILTSFLLSPYPTVQAQHIEVQILKKIMVSNESADFVVRSKTGLGQQDNQNIGWYVGYIETKTNVYFANCIQSKTIEYEHFINARTEIVDLILRELNLINE